MAFCTNCGQKIDDDINFCPNCGQAVGLLRSQNTEYRKTVYEGAVHKCPNCGEQLEAFVSSCPSCGYELRGTNGTSQVDKLARKLENTTSRQRRIELIKDFYIPNTKEDIYEFIILATSNIDAGSDDIEAWYTKLEQAYQKATLSFGNTPDFQYVNQLYKKANKGKIPKILLKAVKESTMMQCVALIVIGVLMIFIGVIGTMITGDDDSPIGLFMILGMWPILGAVIWGSINYQKAKNK